MKVYVTCNICTRGWPQVELIKNTQDNEEMTCADCLIALPKLIR